MPRLRKSSPVIFTEEELQFVAFVTANIGGDPNGYRGVGDSIHRKLCMYFGMDVCAASWYDRIRDKVNLQASGPRSIYFTAHM